MKWIQKSPRASLALMLVLVLASAFPALARVRKEVHKSYPMAQDGTVGLRNVNGNALVKVWNKNEVKIDAVKYADDEDALNQLRIRVTTEGNGIEIETRYPDQNRRNNDNGARVDYVITVPRTASLRHFKIVNGKIDIDRVEGKVDASTVNGEIIASGLSQSCEFKTVNGKVNAVFSSLPGDAAVKIESVNGPLVVKLPRDVNATITANVTTGSISNEFGLETYQESHPHSLVKVGDSLKGKIGDGKADIRLSAVNGSIRILK